jgi:hypothetical protein
LLDLNQVAFRIYAKGVKIGLCGGSYPITDGDYNRAVFPVVAPSQWITGENTHHIRLGIKDVTKCVFIQYDVFTHIHLTHSENIYLWLKFENDQLGWVDFGWGRKVITAEWTRELVDAEVERYRSFLMNSLQVNKSFPHELAWGRVYACHDEKAGAPAMGIVYRGFEFRSLR